MEEDINLEPVENKLIKKIIIILLALLLIILILSFLLTNPEIRVNIKGLIESSKINDEIIESGNITVIIPENLYDELLQIKQENADVEFKVCLIADYDSGNYSVKEIYKPIIYTQEYSQVVSAPCPENALIDLHSHPYRHCSFSEQDINSFKQSKNENSLMMVMCEDNRFNIYK
ncbi:MAG: hypothetical protein PHG05_03485 [Candidatus Nanoarchaeia archaeon]|nr:hypothetical protein [Candidatus Nanoarchaeia archaeon]